LLTLCHATNFPCLQQSYSIGGPWFDSGPLNGDWRTSSASQRSIL